MMNPERLNMRLSEEPDPRLGTVSSEDTEEKESVNGSADGPLPNQIENEQTQETSEEETKAFFETSQGDTNKLLVLIDDAPDLFQQNGEKIDKIKLKRDIEFIVYDGAPNFLSMVTTRYGLRETVRHHAESWKVSKVIEPTESLNDLVFALNFDIDTLSKFNGEEIDKDKVTESLSEIIEAVGARDAGAIKQELETLKFLITTDELDRYKLFGKIDELTKAVLYENNPTSSEGSEESRGQIMSKEAFRALTQGQKKIEYGRLYDMYDEMKRNLQNMSETEKKVELEKINKFGNILNKMHTIMTSENG